MRGNQLLPFLRPQKLLFAEDNTDQKKFSWTVTVEANISWWLISESLLSKIISPDLSCQESRGGDHCSQFCSINTKTKERNHCIAFVSSDFWFLLLRLTRRISWKYGGTQTDSENGRRGRASTANCLKLIVVTEVESKFKLKINLFELGQCCWIFAGSNWRAPNGITSILLVSFETIFCVFHFNKIGNYPCLHISTQVLQTYSTSLGLNVHALGFRCWKICIFLQNTNFTHKQVAFTSMYLKSSTTKTLQQLVCLPNWLWKYWLWMGRFCQTPKNKQSTISTPTSTFPGLTASWSCLTWRLPSLKWRTAMLLMFFKQGPHCF